MKISVLVISLDKRSSGAVALQGVLTRWGCIIKTRLGIHAGIAGSCTDSGLIILELMATSAQKLKFIKELKSVPALKLKAVEL